MSEHTIGNIVLNNSGGEGLEAFDILLAALQAIDPDATGLLGAALDPTQELTVFAPTDDAFINLAQVIDPTVTTEADAVTTLVGASALLSPSDDPTAFLRTVVSYHISAGAKSSAEIAALPTVDTLIGVDLTPTATGLADEEPDLADPDFVAGLTDLPADNGVVHVIDNVLLPYDITFADGGFEFTFGGNDALIGSDRGDYVFLGSGDDVANTGGGNDFVNGGTGNDTIIGGDGHDWLRGSFGDDMVEGGNGADIVTGNFGSDLLHGGSGDDRIYGGGNGDVMKGGDGNDIMLGGWGKDALYGGANHDHLYGGKGDDKLVGGKGADKLNGGKGEDRLEGSSGDDYLRGGLDADQFVFNPNNLGDAGSADEGHDRVADFSLAQGDTLVLDLSTFEQSTLDSIAASDGDTDLELTDFLAEGIVTLAASADGDLLISHPAGTIELDGIPSTVDPTLLIPAVEFEFI